MTQFYLNCNKRLRNTNQSVKDRKMVVRKIRKTHNYKTRHVY